MKFGLDTSVVLRLLTGQPEDQAGKALEWLMQAKNRDVSIEISDLVLAETYYALQYHYEVSKEKALNALRELISDPAIRVQGVGALILQKQRLGNARPGFVDQLIHAQYHQESKRMLTFEKAARKLSNTEVLT
ncbi:PIN domain-containing protein [Kamptonema cortianum]|nr:PIN domain-containing protein [Oscillatoria laete-virens]MDK3159955.1 PIN domain-containing protein [Kamptonema cortianum]MDL5047178.1 PIN domain-containing protein [Oscillatoria amoena NRMC-F 0135]MDL5055490.1 PIN domain-containing protein [Oscillatoria laete-virens NRMC-F 0139]